MVATEQHRVLLFVDRNCPDHWIVLDPDGNLWAVPSVDNPWDRRWPFIPNEQTDLEMVPGHYKHMLQLPF